MIATNDVVFDAWTGVIIRNNLLYAAGKVWIEDEQQTLRERIDTFTLTDTHPLYKELKDGFPKGYVITNFSHSDMQSSSVEIKKNEIFSFSFVLTGVFCEYKSYFFQAFRLMCERGIGKPLTPFLLLDISEQSQSGESQIIAVAKTDLSTDLQYPVRLADFIADNEPDECSEITVRYVTPIILFKFRTKENFHLSYQNKYNHFPSFYQLVCSAIFRLQKLYAMYMDEECNPASFDETLMFEYLEKAGQLLLQSTNLNYLSLQNSLTKEKINEPLSGYVGEQTYSGYFREYLALLQFMKDINIGDETVYGMGQYEVETGDGHRKRQDHKRISTLIIRFKNCIEYSDIPTFRKEILNILADNPDIVPDLNSRQYSYPLIQCKRLNGKASILCLEEGTERIGEVFSNIKTTFHFNGQESSLELDTVKVYKIMVQTWKSFFAYSICKWRPFNKMNYKKFRLMDNMQEKIVLLEELLTDSILSFAKGTGIRLEQEPICLITGMDTNEERNQDNDFVLFDLMFRTNVLLPNYIGLGKGAELGFGTIVQLNNNEKNQ
jgi:hypothetical protein